MAPTARFRRPGAFRLSSTGVNRTVGSNPSCSANASEAPVSPWARRPQIPQYSWAISKTRLYLRVLSQAIFCLETAFFSRASYFVNLVQFRKVNCHRHNLKPNSPQVRIPLDGARVTVTQHRMLSPNRPEILLSAEEPEKFPMLRSSQFDPFHTCTLHSGVPTGRAGTG
jgi:hypothetical protein